MGALPFALNVPALMAARTSTRILNRISAHPDVSGDLGRREEALRQSSSAASCRPARQPATAVFGYVSVTWQFV
jgi:hypothetical protein